MFNVFKSVHIQSWHAHVCILLSFFTIGIDSVPENASLLWQVHHPRLADDMQKVASKSTVCHDYMLQLLLIEIVVHNLSEMFLFSNIFIKTYISMRSVYLNMHMRRVQCQQRMMTGGEETRSGVEWEMLFPRKYSWDQRLNGCREGVLIPGTRVTWGCSELQIIFIDILR